MPSLRGIIYAFICGDLSPRLEGRGDLVGIYDRGVAEMLNYVATVEGPAVKRSGFRHIRAAASTSTWLTPFVFNVTQAYVSKLENSDRVSERVLARVRKAIQKRAIEKALL